MSEPNPTRRTRRRRRYVEEKFWETCVVAQLAGGEDWRIAVTKADKALEARAERFAVEPEPEPTEAMTGDEAESAGREEYKRVTEEE